jgi:hypothetical protein
MRFMTTAATAATALLATLAAGLAAPAAQAAGPTPRGTVTAYKVKNDGGHAVTVTAWVSCMSDDTVTLDIVVSQTVRRKTPNEPAPYGETSTKVACTERIEEKSVRVPILRDGPVTPGRTMVVATGMFNSGGKKISSHAAELRIGN